MERCLLCKDTKQREYEMKRNNVKKLALAGVFCALAVVGSLISFPVLGSKCAPVQHIVNVLCAVILGPGYGMGTLLAFPGSMIGALFGGLAYRKWKKLGAACLGEVFGTSVLGGLCAWPMAILFMGKSAGDVAFYAYIVPFLISTAVGSALAWLLLAALSKSKLLSRLQAELNAEK